MVLRLVLFDFDGTLADTLNAIAAIADRIAPEFGYAPIPAEEIETLRATSLPALIQKSGIAPWKIPAVYRRVRTELTREIDKIHPFPGIREELLALQARGLRLGIVTSNDSENVARFLHACQLSEAIDFVRSGLTIFGKHRLLRQAIAETGLPARAVAYVGDEARDVEAARKAGLTAIAVGWGFNAPELLAKHEPDLLLRSPNELSGAIAALSAGASHL